MNMMTPPQAAGLTESVMTEGVSPPATAPRRRLALWLGGGVVLAAAIAGFGYHEMTGGSVAVVRPAQAATSSRMADGSFRLSPAEARLLRVQPVALRAFREERVAEGRIAYNEDRATPVFAPYSGRVRRVLVQQGQQVQAGDVLFEIETTDLSQAANDLLAAVDGLGKARAQVELTRRNEARQRDLFAARAAARRDLEQAQAELTNALADERTAEAVLAAARDRLRVLGRDADAVAQIERTRRVDATVAVVAPLAGTVVQRRLGPNQWLTAGGGDPVFTIADLSEMWMVAQVRELDAPAMRQGQAVEVTVDALPGRSFPGVIGHVASAIDPVTRRLTVRASVRDTDQALKPEMFATFRIALGDAPDALAVPAGALIRHGHAVTLWEALGEDRFVLRQVRTGLQADGFVQVTEGLRPGARVVTGGALFIDRAAQD
ncbi:efflux RND transporter periplasmic adaptor subunit [Falsiroseomonas ponticola]|jgi:cobalt-zinc-cadmium efflux system membrane fusion protein|uniref:efflux RND transporter periplasmic adaptor subunit n=1 Tax=Falsiroseomonas ponticola TaxID=2786951 RepID=UPI0019321074|nr:efflux RND transporter periplasmic adaptor subunit [Roseomonas ponticola]